MRAAVRGMWGAGGRLLRAAVRGMWGAGGRLLCAAVRGCGMRVWVCWGRGCVWGCVRGCVWGCVRGCVWGCDGSWWGVPRVHAGAWRAVLLVRCC